MAMSSTLSSYFFLRHLARTSSSNIEHGAGSSPHPSRDAARISEMRNMSCILATSQYTVWLVSYVDNPRLLAFGGALNTQTTDTQFFDFEGLDPVIMSAKGESFNTMLCRTHNEDL